MDGIESENWMKNKEGILVTKEWKLKKESENGLINWIKKNDKIRRRKKVSNLEEIGKWKFKENNWMKEKVKI